MVRMRRLARSIVVPWLLVRPRQDQPVTGATWHDMDMEMRDGLFGQQALVGHDVDVHARIQLLGHLGGHLARLTEDFGGARVLDVLAWQDHDVALCDGAEGLDDQEFGIPWPMVDLGHGVLDVGDDGAEDAFAVGEGDHGGGDGGGSHLGVVDGRAG